MTDAERFAWLKKQATQSTPYDIFGGGGHWHIGFYSPDSSMTLEQVIDMHIAKERK